MALVSRRGLKILAVPLGVLLAGGVDAARAATSVSFVPAGGSDTSDASFTLASVTSDNGVYDNYAVPNVFDPTKYQELTFMVSPFPAGAYLTAASVNFNWFEKATTDAVLQVWEAETASWQTIAIGTAASDNAEITLNPSVLAFIDTAPDAAAVKVRFLAAKAANGPTARTDLVQFLATYDIDNTAPAVTLTAPAPGSSHSAPIQLEANASDNGGAGLRRVVFQYSAAGSGGPWQAIASVAAAPYTCNWTPPSDGVYDLRAVAEDFALNQTAEAIAGIAYDAAPSFLNLTPTPGTSVSSATPAISVDVVDAADGVHPASLRLLVNGADVTPQTAVTAVAGGYRLSYLPAVPLAWGSRNSAEARGNDSQGNAGTRTWVFYIDLRFEAGAIVLDTNHSTTTDQQVYDAYGLAERLAGQGVVVDWVIQQTKAYEGVDLTAQVDDSPNRATPGADGTVLIKNYAGGPFVIRDPNPATAYNEAWDQIAELMATFGYAPNIDEVRTAVAASRTNVMFLTYRPKIAVGDTLATSEMVQAQIPYTAVTSPGTSTDPASVAGGGLFYPTADPLCGRVRKYDLYMQGHYDWEGPNANQLAAIGELDQMVGKAGMAVFQCLSASIEDTAHWITEPGSAIVEGNADAASFTPDPTRLGHPFLQTMDTIPIEGGGFSIWDRNANQFKPNLQNILFDNVNGDIGYVFGAVGSGKAYYMGGHKRQELSDRRLMLNAILYNVVYPKFDRKYLPSSVVAGTDNVVTVQMVAKGGSVSFQTHVEDRLDTNSSFLPGSVVLYSPGSTYAYDAASKTLSFELGDLNPYDHANGVVGTYQVNVHPPVEGVVKMLDHTTTYRDSWGASYRYDSTGCSDVNALPMLSLSKSASRAAVVAGSTTRMTLRMVVRNNHSAYPINQVRVTDTLPSGVAFVAGTISASKGTADWGVTTPATLTWNAGVLVPGEEETLTFQVDVTAGAAGPFLVNDGAAATASDSAGNPLTGSSDPVYVTAIAATSPLLDFDLTPGSVVFSSQTGLTYCARNLGAAKTFKADTDQLVLHIPSEFSAPISPAVPSGWRYVWDGTERTLTFFRNSDLSWTTGTSICFSFDLDSPVPPITYPFPTTGTIASGAWSFSETLPLVVLRASMFTFAPNRSGAAEPCQGVVYVHTIFNRSNGVDIFNLSTSGSHGYAMALYHDADLSGTLSPGDSLLSDLDRDGIPDSPPVGHLVSIQILAVVTTGTTGVALTDTATVTARSAGVPSASLTVTDTTSVSALAADVTPNAPAICPGGSLTLDAGAGFAAYSWSTGATSRTITVAPAATTAYTATVTNASGCSASASETATVLAAPAPSITPALPSTCSGAAVTLDAGAGYSAYLWSTGAATRTITVSPATTTAYSVTVTSAAGCTGSASRTVTVNANPVASIAPAAPAICSGTAVTLDAGAGYSSYLWSTGATTRTITVSPSVTTAYSVTVTNAAGCSASASRTVTVQAPPAPVISPAAPATCQGSPITLDAGAGYSSYLWSTGATTRTITVSPGATTSYSVTVTDTGGCSGSASRTVTVSPNPAPAITPPATSVCGGNSAVLDAGAGFASYLWSTGATTRTITVSPAATSSYSVTVTSAAGCTGNASATVTVVNNPVVTPANPELCAGSSVTLDAGSGFQSYLWSTGETTQTITVSPASTATYDVTVTSSGCSGSSSSTVTVRLVPSGNVSPASTAICPGAAATLDAGAGFDTYLWSTGATTRTITVTPAATAAYTVTVGNQYGCAASANADVTVHPAVAPVITPPSPTVCSTQSSVTLDAGPGYAAYLWSTGAATQTITVSPAAATTYDVTVTAGTGCTGAASATVAVLTSPVVQPQDPRLCAGGSLTLDAGPGFASYLWSTGETTRSIIVSPAATTAYTVSVTAANGCAGSGQSTVTVDPLPVPVFANPAPETCEGTAVVLDAGSGFDAYLWSTGESTRTITVAPSGTTSYSVSVTRAGCSGSGSLTVTVGALPAAQAGPDWTICPSGSVRLGGAAEGGRTYSWQPAIGLDDPSAAQPMATPGATTAYTLSVTDAATGCTTTDGVTVLVLGSAPEVALGNVLLGTKSADRSDVVHHWTDVPGATEYGLVWSGSRSMAGTLAVSSVAQGLGLYVEPGAVAGAAGTVRHYQISGDACTPLQTP